MAFDYEVVAFKRDLPKCDSCGFEDANLETTESDETVDTGEGDYRKARFCRYCFETDLGRVAGSVYASRVDAQTRTIARGIVHAFNVLELAMLRDKPPPVVVNLAPTENRRRKQRRKRELLGGKFRGEANRRITPERRKET